MICKECGAENRDGLSYCAGCGLSLSPAPEEKKKSKKLYTLLALGAAAVFLIAIVLTCLLSPEPYEKTAKNFIAAVLENDMQQVESLMAPGIYAYAGSSLDLKSPMEEPKVSIGTSRRTDSVKLLEYNELLVSLKNDGKMTASYSVDISYSFCHEGKQTQAEVTVILGKIGENWYVVDLASS